MRQTIDQYLADLRSLMPPNSISHDFCPESNLLFISSPGKITKLEACCEGPDWDWRVSDNEPTPGNLAKELRQTEWLFADYNCHDNGDIDGITQEGLPLYIGHCEEDGDIQLIDGISMNNIAEIHAAIYQALKEDWPFESCYFKALSLKSKNRIVSLSSNGWNYEVHELENGDFLVAKISMIPLWVDGILNCRSSDQDTSFVIVDTQEEALLQHHDNIDGLV